MGLGKDVHLAELGKDPEQVDGRYGVGHHDLAGLCWNGHVEYPARLVVYVRDDVSSVDPWDPAGSSMDFWDPAGSSMGSWGRVGPPAQVWTLYPCEPHLNPVLGPLVLCPTGQHRDLRERCVRDHDCDCVQLEKKCTQYYWKNQEFI